MDDLEYIKKCLPQTINEAKTFRSGTEAFEALMDDVVEAHQEVEFELGPDSDAAMALEAIVRKYSHARIKRS